MRFPWQSTERRCAEARMLASDLDLALADQEPALAGPVLDEIKARFESLSPGEEIAAAIELRKLLARTYPVDRLELLVEHLRRRYARATGAMPDSSPHPNPAPAGAADGAAPEAAADATHAALLAEAESLLEKLKLVYTFSSERDRRTAGFRWVFIGTLAGLFVLLGVVAAFPEKWDVSDLNSILNYAVLFVAAATGATVSIMQRIQAASDVGPSEVDPVRQISGLRHGLGGMVIAAIMGPAMAFVLLAVFVSGVIKVEGLSPEFVSCGSPDASGLVGGEFLLLDRCVQLKSSADAARLLIAAFLAGFAERLVPDVLDRIVGAAKAKKV